MKYKSVLFDMDGTILDTLGDLCSAVNHTLANFGYPEISEPECAQILGKGARYLVETAAPEGANVDEMLDYYMPYYKEHCLDRTAPYAGIMELMEYLKQQDVKMAIISNKPDAATKELSKKFFDGLVDFAVGASSSVKSKPDPDTVLAAIEHFGLTKQDCVYIGDTEIDVKTAFNAGIDLIAVKWGFRTEEQLIACGAKKIVSDTQELKDALT